MTATIMENAWGKGATRAEALKNMLSAANTRKPPKKYKVLQVGAEARIDGYGGLSYKYMGEEYENYLTLEDTTGK